MALLIFSACSKEDPRYILPSVDISNSVLTIVPFNTTMNKGTTQQYKAILIAPSGAQSDVSDANTTTWTVEDTTVASIDENATLKASKEGSTTVVVNYGDLSAKAALVVTDKGVKSLSVTPQNSLSIVGLTTQYYAEVIYADSTTQDVTNDVVWSSLDVAKATIDAKSGLASSLADGNVTISAKFGSTDANATLVILSAGADALEIKPNPIELPINATQQYSATLILDDNNTIDVTHDVDWASTSGDISSITPEALLTAHKEGENDVFALLSYAGQYIYSNAKVTVLPATLKTIDVTPKELSVPVGAYGNYFAVGTYSDGSTRNITDQVAWSVGDTTIGYMDANGLATALSSGTTEVKATLEGKSGSTTVTVTPATLESISVIPATETLPTHIKLQYSAYGHYSDNTVVELTDVVSWSVDEVTGKANFDVSKKGLLTTLERGNVKPTATFEGQSAHATLVIIEPFQLKYAKLTPHESTVPVGTNANFTLIVTYDIGSGKTLDVDVTRQSTWKSSLPEAVSVDAQGYAKALAVTSYDDAVISARFSGVSYTATVEVSDAVLVSIVVTPPYVALAVGASQHYTAEGTYSDNSVHNITDTVVWSLENSADIGYFDAVKWGLFIGTSVGSDNVEATLGSKSAKTPVTVQ